MMTALLLDIGRNASTTFILEERLVWYPNWLPFSIVFMVGILGAVRLLNAGLIPSVFYCLFTRPSSATNFREAVTIQGKTSYLLVLNFALSASVFSFMLISLKDANDFSFFLIPFLVLFYPLFAMALSGWISGELKRIRENFHIYSMMLQFIGLFLIPLNLVLMLNPLYLDTIGTALISLLALMYLIRCYRGMTYALQNKVNWYYLILYLCGLEILPCLVLYKYAIG